MSRKLTGKQKQFIVEYLKDLNATQAAIRAGYSENTADQMGFENLRKPKIHERIQKEMDKRSVRTRIDADDILNDIKETRDQCKEAMVYIDEDGNKKVDSAALNGRIKNNELLGKHLKLFTDRVEHSGEMKIEGVKIELVD